jgi:hypothetical protein
MSIFSDIGAAGKWFSLETGFTTPASCNWGGIWIKFFLGAFGIENSRTK